MSCCPAILQHLQFLQSRSRSNKTRNCKSSLGFYIYQKWEKRGGARESRRPCTRHSRFCRRRWRDWWGWGRRRDRFGQRRRWRGRLDRWGRRLEAGSWRRKAGIDAGGMRGQRQQCFHPIRQKYDGTFYRKPEWSSAEERHRSKTRQHGDGRKRGAVEISGTGACRSVRQMQKEDGYGSGSWQNRGKDVWEMSYDGYGRIMRLRYKFMRFLISILDMMGLWSYEGFGQGRARRARGICDNSKRDLKWFKMFLVTGAI